MTFDVSNGKNIGYVLPQRINVESGENVKLYFRVSNTFKDCVIKVACNGKELASVKKKVAVPGEMQTLLLLKDKIEKIDGEVTVWLEE